jgi:hypothetical protein
MGQRHQIYVRFPQKLGIAGFHHQWLYGMNAVKSLARVAEFYKNSSEYSPLKQSTGYGLHRQSRVIEALYSVDIKSGYWHHVANLLDEVENGETPPEVLDPRNGDNNDGITIIDLSKGDFRYCFMSVGHLEGEVNPETLKPMSALDYLLCYYPAFLEGLGGFKYDAQKREYSTTEREALNEEDIGLAVEALNMVDDAKLLTLEEVAEMFPAMLPKPKAKAKPKAPSRATEVESEPKPAKAKPRKKVKSELKSSVGLSDKDIEALVKQAVSEALAKRKAKGA